MRTETPGRKPHRRTASPRERRRRSPSAPLRCRRRGCGRCWPCRCLGRERSRCSTNCRRPRSHRSRPWPRICRWCCLRQRESAGSRSRWPCRRHCRSTSGATPGNETSPRWDRSPAVRGRPPGRRRWCRWRSRPESVRRRATRWSMQRGCRPGCTATAAKMSTGMPSRVRRTNSRCRCRPASRRLFLRRRPPPAATTRRWRCGSMGSRWREPPGPMAGSSSNCRAAPARTHGSWN